MRNLKNIDVAQIAAEKYIKSNYDIYGNLTLENIYGVCIVNCDGNVEVKNKKIKKKLTDGFMWGEIEGDFRCPKCDKLISLEGAPKVVGRDFKCFRCPKLTSLQGTPEKVGRNFDCSDCKNIDSLRGAPKEVGGDFYCSGCYRLESLEGAPEKVGSNFYSFNCPNLKP